MLAVSEHTFEEKDSDGVGFDVDAFEKEMLPVLREGYLFKKKQKGLRLGVFNWQYRYCILDNERQVLRYGPYELREEGARIIPFDELKRAYLSKNASANDLEKSKGLPSGQDVEFNVELVPQASKKNGSRVFVFRAQDPLDAFKWVAALQSVCTARLKSSNRGRRLSQVLESKLNKINQHEGENKSAEIQDTEAKEDDEEKKVEVFEIQLHDDEGEKETKSSDISSESKARLRSLTERIIARAREKRSRNRQFDVDTDLSQTRSNSLPSLPPPQNKVFSAKNPFQKACFPCFAFCFGRQDPEPALEFD